MIKTMYIGSGDVKDLLAGKETKGHHELIKRFVSGLKPYYNAKSSPIDACRTGAILEDRYLLSLDDCYYAQFTVFSKEMDVFKASLDFAKLDSGKIVDFDELKAISFGDYLNFIPYKDNNKLLLEKVKKDYKQYYNQVQEQLYCTGLESANLVFIPVFSYDDEENAKRDIGEDEKLKIRIQRDEKVIRSIKERGYIFQQIKNCYR